MSPHFTRGAVKKSTDVTLPGGRGFHEKAVPVKPKLFFGRSTTTTQRRPTGGVPGPITTNGDPRPTGGPPPPTFYSLGNVFDFWSCHHSGDRDQRERPFLLQLPCLVLPPPTRPASIRTLQWERFAPGASWGP